MLAGKPALEHLPPTLTRFVVRCVWQQRGWKSSRLEFLAKIIERYEQNSSLFLEKIIFFTRFWVGTGSMSI